MKRTTLYHFHEEQGARLLPDSEPRPLLTYGDVPGEYQAAKSAWIALDETDRGAVHAKGADAATFLHGLLANEVRNLEVGFELPNLLLDAKGKVRFVFELQRLAPDEFLMSAEPGQAGALLQALDMYHFSEDVTLTEVTEEHSPITVAGPAAAEALEGLIGQPVPQEGSLEMELGSAQVVITRCERAGLAAWRLNAGPEESLGLWQALIGAGARPIGRIVWDSLRVEVGVAQPGEDIDDTVYPQEARLERAFSLDKGCYIGQEVVAKIDTYGGLNKRLFLLRSNHDDPVARGTRLYRQDPDTGEWRDLGVATSWAYSFAHDCGVILAFVKRKHQIAGTTFRIGEGPAEASIIELEADAD